MKLTNFYFFFEVTKRTKKNPITPITLEPIVIVDTDQCNTATQVEMDRTVNEVADNIGRISNKTNGKMCYLTLS